MIFVEKRSALCQLAILATYFQFLFVDKLSADGSTRVEIFLQASEYLRGMRKVYRMHGESRNRNIHISKNFTKGNLPNFYLDSRLHCDLGVVCHNLEDSLVSTQ